MGSAASGAGVMSTRAAPTRKLPFSWADETTANIPEIRMPASRRALKRGFIGRFRRSGNYIYSSYTTMYLPLKGGLTRRLQMWNRRLFLAATAGAAITGKLSAAETMTPVRSEPLRATYWGPEYYDDKEQQELTEVLNSHSPFRWYGPGKK